MTTSGKNHHEYAMAYDAASAGGCIITHRDSKLFNDLTRFSSKTLLNDVDDGGKATACVFQPLIQCRRGCLVLGTSDAVSASKAIDNVEAGGVYLTNYGIDHERQARGLCAEVFLEECSPCCRSCRHGRSSNKLTNVAIGVLASAIRSEIFLYTLHMTAIALGAIKEAVGLRTSDPTLNLIQSSVETAATVLLVIIRMFNAYSGYRRVRRSLTHIVHYNKHSERCLRRGNGAPSHECDQYQSEEIHIQQIRQWMAIQLFAGFMLLVICLSLFFIFLEYAHLGWTVLSNNFCLITITMLGSIYAARVSVAVNRISEDLHKVVIYEAQLIIRENIFLNSANGLQRRSTGNTGFDCCDKVLAGKTDGLRFIEAVDKTRLFNRPSYIIYCGDNQSLHAPPRTFSEVTLRIP